MKRFLTVPLMLALLLFTGCATVHNPQQAMLQVRADYTIAVEAAAYYGTKPFCDSPGAPVLCASRPIVLQLQVAKDGAKPIIDQAEATVLDPKFNGENADVIVLSAQNALKAITSITSALNIHIPPKP